MFNRLKNALAGSPTEAGNGKTAAQGNNRALLAPKFPYGRPHFLNLGEEQVQASADHRLRPIISPNSELPFYAGYAECINAGKSKWNEDQAVTQHGLLVSSKFNIPYKFFGLFDGHAGVGAAICASHQMHHVVHERLVDAQDDLWDDYIRNEEPFRRTALIIGALEAAFREMDDIIKDDFPNHQSIGGCTALVAVFILGSLYVANAGDSRGIICQKNAFMPMSTDFTPETERQRIRQLAQVKPHLLGKEFTYMEYSRQPKQQDLGKRILYRDAFMTGWAYKTIGPEDLKLPIITGNGKRSRVMGTIGVTRGFGDHELVSVHQKVLIKPFLSCHPEVQVFDVKHCSKHDVLVLGTDGLWDVLDGQTTVMIVSRVIENFRQKEMYISAATCLVGAARGNLKEHAWIMKNGKQASVDDISVFVIPLFPCAKMHAKMEIGMRPVCMSTAGQNPIEFPVEYHAVGADMSLENHNYSCSTFQSLQPLMEVKYMDGKTVFVRDGTLSSSSSSSNLEQQSPVIFHTITRTKHNGKKKSHSKSHAKRLGSSEEQLTDSSSKSFDTRNQKPLAIKRRQKDDLLTDDSSKSSDTHIQKPLPIKKSQNDEPLTDGTSVLSDTCNQKPVAIKKRQKDEPLIDGSSKSTDTYIQKPLVIKDRQKDEPLTDASSKSSDTHIQKPLAIKKRQNDEPLTDGTSVLSDTCNQKPVAIKKRQKDEPLIDGSSKSTDTYIQKPLVIKDRQKDEPLTDASSKSSDAHIQKPVAIKKRQKDEPLTDGGYKSSDTCNQKPVAIKKRQKDEPLTDGISKSSVTCNQISVAIKKRQKEEPLTDGSSKSSDTRSQKPVAIKKRQKDEPLTDGSSKSFDICNQKPVAIKKRQKEEPLTDCSSKSSKSRHQKPVAIKKRQEEEPLTDGSSKSESRHHKLVAIKKRQEEEPLTDGSSKSESRHHKLVAIKKRQEEEPLTDGSSKSELRHQKLVVIKKRQEEEPLTDESSKSSDTRNKELVVIKQSQNEEPLTDGSSKSTESRSRKLIVIKSRQNEEPLTDGNNKSPDRRIQKLLALKKRQKQEVLTDGSSKSSDTCNKKPGTIKKRQKEEVFTDSSSTSTDTCNKKPVMIKKRQKDEEFTDGSSKSTDTCNQTPAAIKKRQKEKRIDILRSRYQKDSLSSSYESDNEPMKKDKEFVKPALPSRRNRRSSKLMSKSLSKSCIKQPESQAGKSCDSRPSSKEIISKKSCTTGLSQKAPSEFLQLRDYRPSYYDEAFLPTDTLTEAKLPSTKLPDCRTDVQLPRETKFDTNSTQSGPRDIDPDEYFGRINRRLSEGNKRLSSFDKYLIRRRAKSYPMSGFR